MMTVMRRLGEMVRRPDEIYPSMKWTMMVRAVQKQLPPQPHWAFCYSMLLQATRNLGFSILQLPLQLRKPMMIFYLVLRALDTIEDDMSLSSEVKIPILIAFHEHIYDHDWQFSCGSPKYKVLMDNFYNVRTAFLELETSHREVIKDVTKRMGAGMAKFISKEVETMDDLHEYAHYSAGVYPGISRIFRTSKLEDSSCHSADQEHLYNSMALLVQKSDVIRDYLEDVHEAPEPRRFWPRCIWGKYVNKLEDFKHEENSAKAVQCLNEMVMYTLTDVEDSLKNLSSLKDPVEFRFYALHHVAATGMLALCYNNIDVFRSASNLKLRPGLAAKLFDRIWTISDLCRAILEFSSLMKSKVEKHDPNSVETLVRIEAIEHICKTGSQQEC
ncbi:squalene synthase 2-like isoform X2 [Punica granatum]|uniref:Squalene synthase 2-like isoform X2 n=1 Tax=Punica granatum TaxID=22663 RepID=A0A6P8CF90_PUNGR|nr:squalene synthase 2-like isoform X2 [Punica granatum]